MIGLSICPHKFLMIDPTVKKKIKTLDELRVLVPTLKKKGKIIVHCHGVFDLVHLGHIRYFHQARREGDILIVTLTADTFVKRGPGRPLFSEVLRAENVAALAAVDFVAIVPEATALSAIRIIRPQIYAKGPDYKQKEKDITGMISTEEDAVVALGGRLLITDDISFSSSRLLNTYFNAYPEKTREFLHLLAKQFSIDTVASQLQKAEKLKVLVIGDAIIDEYHYAAPIGKSSKEPLVVHLYQSQESFAGGVLATANHTANIVRRVDMVSVLGKQDLQREFINQHLLSQVHPRFFVRPDAGTTIKRRYISETGNRKVFEVYYMNDQPIAAQLEKQINDYLIKNLKHYDLVIVNDFGHGFLTKQLIATICRKSKKIALNVQTNSANIGFNLVTKYPRADFVCIDEQELRFATHEKLTDIKKLMQLIQTKLKTSFIITTRGPKGSLSLSKKNGFIATPSFAPHVIDPVGAGDAFFAYTAPAWASGMEAPLLCFLGNAVGSLAVQIVGNRESVKKVDVIKFMTRLLK